MATRDSLGFDAGDGLRRVDALTDDELDALPFGVIGVDADGLVCRYNRAESALSGLDPAHVVGRSLFDAVAPCMNVPQVAGRFREAERLDETLDFLFTVRMKPTPVVLRLLADPGVERTYLFVRRPEERG